MLLSGVGLLGLVGLGLGGPVGLGGGGDGGLVGRVGGLVGAGRGLQRHHVIAGGGRCCKGRKTLLVAQVHP